MKKNILTVIGILSLGVILGIAAFPSLFFLQKFLFLYDRLNVGAFFFLYSIIVGLSYIIFGFTLLIVIVILRFIFKINSSPISNKINSSTLYNFAAFHGLIAIAEKFFLPLIRGTFILNLFYKGLGMKIGNRTIINTTKISDCNLIEIGNNCVIGGDVIINGHSAEGDYLHKGKVKIGNNVSIGSYTTVLCGVTIEDNVIIGANSFIPKNSIIPKGAIYGGVPVKRLKSCSESSLEKKKSESSFDVDIKKEIELLKNSDKYVSILNTQYQKLHSEILAIESFIINIFVSSLGILFTVLMYGIIEEPKTILTLPPLAILSAAVIMSTTTAMLRIAFKMSEIEIYFQKAGFNLFNWENKYGALGIPRIKELDGILVLLVYGIIIAIGIYLTINDSIVSSEVMIFEDIKVKSVLHIINGGIGSWLILSFIYLKYKTSYYKKELDSIRQRLS